MAASSAPLPAGLSEAWTLTSRRLLAFVARRVEDTETAEDITQEVLARLHRAGPGLDDVQSMTAWLYRVARNAIIDHYRARRPSEPLPPELEPETPEPEPAGPNRATEELARCLRPLVEQLPPKYREAIVMVDLAGVTHTAAAGAAGISTSGMKSRVRRGRRQLRELLDACCAVSTDPTGAVRAYRPRPDAGCSCSTQHGTAHPGLA